MVWEGAGALERTTRYPALRSVSATTAANSRERKRRAKPTARAFLSIPAGGSSPRAATAMAALTRRTLSKVKPSAMTARQPSVPKEMSVIGGILVSDVSHRTFVSRELCVGGQQCDAFDERLREEETVEGILVERRKSLNIHRVLARDRKLD